MAAGAVARAAGGAAVVRAGASCGGSLVGLLVSVMVVASSGPARLVAVVAGRT